MAGRILAGALLVAGLVSAGMAGAEPQSEQLFSHKNWVVEIVGFDDGSFSCVAQVSDGEDTFSVWADPWSAVRLQFYSTSWDFSDGGSADLGVQVDRRSPWSLTDAELFKNSVLFSLPEGDSSDRFLMEVVNGSTLHLKNDSGSHVQSYSLAGSSASIQALIACVEALADDSDDNPFN